MRWEVSGGAVAARSLRFIFQDLRDVCWQSSQVQQTKCKKKPNVSIQPTPTFIPPLEDAEEQICFYPNSAPGP